MQLYGFVMGLVHHWETKFEKDPSAKVARGPQHVLSRLWGTANSASLLPRYRACWRALQGVSREVTRETGWYSRSGACRQSVATSSKLRLGI